MEAGSVVRAIFDFCPSVSEELPLFVGDVIEVLAVVDEFWLLGKKEDVTGQFPSSFVEILTIPSLKEGERLLVCTSEFSSQGANSLALHRGDLVILDGSPTAGWLQGRSCWGARGFFPSSCTRELCLSSQSRRWHSQSALLQIPDYSMGQARALMGLSAQLEEELDFREGDVITIIGVPEPGWFEGELDGQRGIFPEGFVELLGPLRTVDKPIGSSTQDGCLSNGVAESPPGEGEGGPEEDEEQPGPYGIALYRFQALEPNELDFDVGDKIQILGTLDDGWLEGSLKGRIGIFPHRFVKLCPNTRAEETKSLPQGSSHTKLSDPSSELALAAEDRRPGSHEYRAEKSHCVISGTSTSLQEQLASEDETDTCSHLDKALLEEPLRSAGTGQGTPLAKASSTSDPLEVVNGVSSQPHVPFHPRVQKTQYYSTMKESLQSADKSSDPLPAQGRSRDYSTLPLRGAYSQLRSSQKPGPAIQSSSLPSPARTAAPSQLSPRLQGLARCSKKHRKSREYAPGLRAGPARSEWLPGSAVQAVALEGGDGSTDLDSKLTQQLMEFEKSLSGPSPEPEKLLRQFSIMEFHSEKDVVCGSSKLTPQQELPERRKALRPPPPRPCTPVSTSSHSLADQDLTLVFPLTVRPSRPAPLPPSAQPRTNAASSNLLTGHRPSCETLEGESPETMEKTRDQTSQQCPLVLVKMHEMGQDLDMYSRTPEELTSPLEEKQDESQGAKPPENVEFYESSVDSWNVDLQPLREMTLLSSQSAPPVTPLATVSTENPEQRMLEKRTKVVEELLQTEKDYIRDLEMCIERIMVPLQQAQVANMDFEGLFGNMQMVIQVSKRLLAALENSDTVGAVFLGHRLELEETYKVYCQNHDEAISLLEVYEKDEKILRHLQDSLAELK